MSWHVSMPPLSHRVSPAVVQRSMQVQAAGPF
jgi:hypothetical protein